MWTIILALTFAFTTFIQASQLPGHLLVANKNNHTISFVDLNNFRITKTLPTGKSPHEIAISPNFLYAVVSNYQSTPATITVFDLEHKNIYKTIDISPYQTPHGVHFINLDHVLVTCEKSKAIIKIDIHSGKILQTYNTSPLSCHMVTTDTQHKYAFGTDIQAGSVAVIDLQSGNLIQLITTAPGAEGLAVSLDNKELWVTNRASKSVSIISIPDWKIVKNLTAGTMPIRVKFCKSPYYALVSNAMSGEVLVFNPVTRERVAMIEFGENAFPVGVLVVNQYAFVALSNRNRVAMVDVNNFAVIRNFNYFSEPDGMGYTIK